MRLILLIRYTLSNIYTNRKDSNNKKDCNKRRDWESGDGDTSGGHFILRVCNRKIDWSAKWPFFEIRDVNLVAQCLGGLRTPNILKTKFKKQMLKNNRIVVKKLANV